MVKVLRIEIFAIFFAWVVGALCFCDDNKENAKWIKPLKHLFYGDIWYSGVEDFFRELDENPSLRKTINLAIQSDPTLLNDANTGNQIRKYYLERLKELGDERIFTKPYSYALDSFIQVRRAELKLTNPSNSEATNDARAILNQQNISEVENPWQFRVEIFRQENAETKIKPNNQFMSRQVFESWRQRLILNLENARKRNLQQAYELAVKHKLSEPRISKQWINDKLEWKFIKGTKKPEDKVSRKDKILNYLASPILPSPETFAKKWASLKEYEKKLFQHIEDEAIEFQHGDETATLTMYELYDDIAIGYKRTWFADYFLGKGNFYRSTTYFYLIEAVIRDLVLKNLMDEISSLSLASPSEVQERLIQLKNKFQDTLIELRPASFYETLLRERLNTVDEVLGFEWMGYFREDRGKLKDRDAQAEYLAKKPVLKLHEKRSVKTLLRDFSREMIFPLRILPKMFLFSATVVGGTFPVAHGVKYLQEQGIIPSHNIKIGNPFQSSSKKQTSGHQDGSNNETPEIKTEDELEKAKKEIIYKVKVLESERTNKIEQMYLDIPTRSELISMSNIGDYLALPQPNELTDPIQVSSNGLRHTSKEGMLFIPVPRGYKLKSLEVKDAKGDITTHYIRYTHPSSGVYWLSMLTKNEYGNYINSYEFVAGFERDTSRVINPNSSFQFKNVAKLSLLSQDLRDANSLPLSYNLNELIYKKTQASDSSITLSDLEEVFSKSTKYAIKPNNQEHDTPLKTKEWIKPHLKYHKNFEFCAQCVHSYDFFTDYLKQYFSGTSLENSVTIERRTTYSVILSNNIEEVTNADFHRQGMLKVKETPKITYYFDPTASDMEKSESDNFYSRTVQRYIPEWPLDLLPIRRPDEDETFEELKARLKRDLHGEDEENLKDFPIELINREAWRIREKRKEIRMAHLNHQRRLREINEHIDAISNSTVLEPYKYKRLSSDLYFLRAIKLIQLLRSYELKEKSLEEIVETLKTTYGDILLSPITTNTELYDALKKIVDFERDKMNKLKEFAQNQRKNFPYKNLLEDSVLTHRVEQLFKLIKKEAWAPKVTERDSFWKDYSSCRHILTGS